MKGKVVIAVDKKGKEYRYPSVLAATQELNISSTTIKIKVASAEPVDTEHGSVTIRFDK